MLSLFITKIATDLHARLAELSADSSMLNASTHIEPGSLAIQLGEVHQIACRYHCVYEPHVAVHHFTCRLWLGSVKAANDPYFLEKNSFFFLNNKLKVIT